MRFPPHAVGPLSSSTSHDRAKQEIAMLIALVLVVAVTALRVGVMVAAIVESVPRRNEDFAPL